MSISTQTLKEVEADDDDDEFDYDLALEDVNPSGLYQIRTCLVLYLGSLSAGIAVVAYAFTGYEPQYRCSVPQCENADNGSYFEGFGREFPEYFAAGFGNGTEVKAAAQACKYITFPDSAASSCSEYLTRLKEGVNLTVSKCTHEDLIFDTSAVLNSVVTQFGFTCSDRIYFNVYNSLYMGGMLAGSIVLGMVSDRFGRKVALMAALALVSSGGIVTAFMPLAWLYGVARFVTGMGGVACFMVPYVLIVENTVPRHKVALTQLVSVGFVLGEMTLSVEAFLVRDWQTLQLVAYAPLAVGLPLVFFFVPESTRWLIAKGRMAEARDQVRWMAKVNGREEPKFQKKARAAAESNAAADPKKVTVLDLMRPRAIAFRSLNMFYQWFSVTLAYYGITFASTGLSGDPYLNFALTSVTELPAFLVGYLSIDAMGRRFMLSCSQAISGAACIAAGLLVHSPDLAALQTALVMLGKFCAGIAFGQVYLFTSELFPTAIRSTAVGASSMVARMGGITSVLLGALRSVWTPLPMVIMGVVAMAAGALATLFPETTGQELPMTTEEAINVGKNSSFRMGSCHNRRK